MMRWMVSAALSVCLISVAKAQDLTSPEGTWEIASRDSRYRVQLCGPAGDALCATLIWLGRDANTPDNAQYMGDMIIDHAHPISPNTWKGQLHLFGQSATGTITQIDDDAIELNGCLYFVICRSYDLFRISN